MSYGDQDFWAKYADYVKENINRHAEAIEQLGGFLSPLLDFGCGKVMEGVQLVIGKSPKYYRGIDTDPLEGAHDGSRVIATIKADYRTDLKKIKAQLTHDKFNPSMGISFFSIEPTAHNSDNEQLYHEIFKTFPTMQRFISAGFYYESKKDLFFVEEPGGIRSHQSNSSPMRSDTLHEYRLLERGPSTLYGADVIEVWRFFTRK